MFTAALSIQLKSAVSKTTLAEHKNYFDVVSHFSRLTLTGLKLCIYLFIYLYFFQNVISNISGFHNIINYGSCIHMHAYINMHMQEFVH